MWPSELSLPVTLLFVTAGSYENVVLPLLSLVYPACFSCACVWFWFQPFCWFLEILSSVFVFIFSRCSFNQFNVFGADLCLKYYRVSKYRTRCVIIVLVERRCTGCTNKWYSLLETTYIYKDFNGVTCAWCLCTYRTVYVKQRVSVNPSLTLHGIT